MKYFIEWADKFIKHVPPRAATEAAK
jgi:hypothetical protein